VFPGVPSLFSVLALLGTPTADVGVPVPLLPVPFALVFVYLFLPVKWVSADDIYLYARGLFHEIAVPLADVISVQRQVPGPNPQLVFVVFRVRTRFGRSVAFIPQSEPTSFGKPIEIEELRRLAGFDGEWRPGTSSGSHPPPPTGA
jgi:hypothetical protein